jgi:hypothetical protein
MVNSRAIAGVLLFLLLDVLLGIENIFKFEFFIKKEFYIILCFITPFIIIASELLYVKYNEKLNINVCLFGILLFLIFVLLIIIRFSPKTI